MFLPEIPINSESPDKMFRIGLLSDTHGFLPAEYRSFFSQCVEVWHCGDIGSEEIVEQLQQFKFLRAVYGNIDTLPIRMMFPEFNLFTIDGLKVLMVHIGGFPGRYEKKVLKIIKEEKPGLVVTGHSHILKVMHDTQSGHLHINPGAAGIFGFHQVVTMVRFTINKGMIKDLEIFEKPKSAYFSQNIDNSNTH